MLTLAAIKENPEEIVRKLAKKHFDAKELINKVLDLDKTRRNSQSELDARLATLKNLSGQIGKLMKEGKKEEMLDKIAQGRINRRKCCIRIGYERCRKTDY